MKRPLLFPLWCSTGTAEPVPLDKYVAGFIKEKPDEYYLNQLQKDEEAFYLSSIECGVPTNDPADDVTYAQGSLYFDGGKVFVRKDGKVSESFFSRPYQTVKVELDAFETRLHNHVFDFNDPHKTTPAQAGTYSIVEVDAKLKQLSDSLSSHVGRKDNPHKLTYLQLNCLGAATGGRFTGAVSFESIVVNGQKLTQVGGDFLLGLPNKGIGISEGQPVAFLGGTKQVIFHKGNYQTERSKVECLQAVPPFLLKSAFLSSIQVQHPNVTAITDWDNLTFDADGLKLGGKLLIDRPTEVVCYEQTVSCTLVGSIVVKWGSTIITASGGTITVVDGTTTVWTGAATKVLYTRNTTTGDVYISGKKVISVLHSGAEPQLVAEISGTGSIRELTIWSEYLSALQASRIY